MFCITSQNPTEISQTSSQNPPMQMREQAHKTLPMQISKTSSQNRKTNQQGKLTESPKQISKTSSTNPT
jgi:hypothetical protein